IAWHLYEVLGLQNRPTKRIVFHEITESAIKAAIENPRDIDIHLVDAQQARRVLDRIVGFELSPVLWRRIRPSLSAGRVQSVSLRLIVEREREINTFVPEVSYRTVIEFILPDGKALTAELQTRFKTKEEARRFLEQSIGADFRITDVTKRPGKRSPAMPFTTSTLQQEAARKLGYTVVQTMRIAQKLYEEGLITYMRTDSVNLSDLALGALKKEITEQWGEKYYQFRRYKTKTKGAQEAHEAIRPTYINKAEIEGTPQEQKLYQLIRRRTIASQMADAVLERTTITIGSNKFEDTLSVQGEVITFDGFLGVYREDTDEEQTSAGMEERLLPLVHAGDTLRLQQAKATESFTQRPPRYTEASLVHKMEELGIGRPSTYAPTIQTIQNRNYVVRGDKPGKNRDYVVLEYAAGKDITETVRTEQTGQDRNKLLPTDMGLIVNDFLVASFPQVVDYNFTAKVEKEFDQIAEGKLQWQKQIGIFYDKFHPRVVEASAFDPEQRVGDRMLGTDPSSGEPIIVRVGRYGPMVQKGHTDKENGIKPQFASLQPNQSIDSITLEEALELFLLPKKLGEYESAEITVAIGRFGPYVKHAGKFVGLPKGVDPLSLTLDDAIELIQDKRMAEEKNLLKSFAEHPDMEIRTGRFGAYIKYQTNNYKIPKTVERPEELTYEDCLKFVEESPAKTTKSKKKEPAKKTTAKKAAKKD
ncbi:type I DNA topoisomerase, partial [Porphyromonas loveana]